MVREFGRSVMIQSELHSLSPRSSLYPNRFTGENSFDFVGVSHSHSSVSAFEN